MPQVRLQRDSGAGMSKKQETSWDQFNNGGSIAILLAIAIVLCLIFPPLWIAFAIGVCVWIHDKFSKGDPNGPRAIAQPDGTWVVYDSQGNIVATGATSEYADFAVRNLARNKR